ncbi:MAG: hypothetical protein GXP29_03945 [Planctomycetes bacterium]|nr:hypothetical protein [Planctomycetota bacterium]
MVGAITTAILNITNQNILPEVASSNPDESGKDNSKQAATNSLSTLSKKQIQQMKVWWNKTGSALGVLTADMFKARLTLFENFLSRCDGHRHGTKGRCIGVIYQAWRLFGNKSIQKHSRGKESVKSALEWHKEAASANEADHDYIWLRTMIAAAEEDVDRRLPKQGPKSANPPSDYRTDVVNAMHGFMQRDSNWNITYDPILNLKGSLAKYMKDEDYQ